MLGQYYNGTDPTQLTAAEDRRILNATSLCQRAPDGPSTAPHSKKARTSRRAS